MGPRGANGWPVRSRGLEFWSAMGDLLFAVITAALDAVLDYIHHLWRRSGQRVRG
jgi:hypothetical protein